MTRLTKDRAGIQADLTQWEHELERIENTAPLPGLEEKKRLYRMGAVENVCKLRGQLVDSLKMEVARLEERLEGRA